MVTTCRNQEETPSRRSERQGASHEQPWWKYRSSGTRARVAFECKGTLALEAVKLNVSAASPPVSSYGNTARRWSSKAKYGLSPTLKPSLVLFDPAAASCLFPGCAAALACCEEHRLTCRCLWIASSHILPLPPAPLSFPPQIMNKIIFVCSMKFLPHFPPLMLILFKVYQLENTLRNLNANDSSKYVYGRYITQRVTYWFFFHPVSSLEMPLRFSSRGSAMYERHN